MSCTTRSSACPIMNPVVAPRCPNNPTPPPSTTIDRPPPSLPADSLEPRRSSRLTITPPRTGLTTNHLPTLRRLITLPFHAWNHQRPSSNAVRILGRIANWVPSTWRIWPCTSSPRGRRPVARPIIGHRSTRIFVGWQDRSTTIRIRRGANSLARIHLLNCVAMIGTTNFATPVPNSSTLFARRNDGSNARRATVAPCTPTTTPMGKTRFCHRASTRICRTGIADTGVLARRTGRLSRIICKCSRR